MTPKNFCYWLNGYLELRQNQNEPLTGSQASIIKEHLQLVFKKVTPNIDNTLLCKSLNDFAPGKYSLNQFPFIPASC